MKVEFGPDFEKSLNRMVWQQRLEPINPMEWFRKLRDFYQRGTRGYADRDVWNFHNYLIKVIAGGCRDLAKNHMGHPMDLGVTKWNKDGWPEHATDKGNAEWEQILEDIATGFEAFEKLEWDEEFEDIPHVDSQRAKDYRAKYEKASKLLIERFGNLWD